MRRWVLFGLTVGLLLLALPGCQTYLPVGRDYVDQRIEDVDAKFSGAWDDAERTLLEAQARGAQDGEAAVAGLKAGATRSRDTLPERESGIDTLLLVLAEIAKALGYGGVGVALTRIMRGAPLKSGSGILEPENVKPPPKGKK